MGCKMTEKKVWQGNKEKHLSKNPLVRFLDKKLKKDIISEITKLKIKSMLDVGCGEGFITKEIAKNFLNIETHAIDPEKQYIEYAKKFNSLPNITYQQATLDTYHSKKEFDLILMTEVLEHLQNPRDYLMKAIAQSSKYILFTVPNEPFFRIGNFFSLKYIKDFGNTPGHIHNWTKHKLKKFLLKLNLKFKIKTSTFWNIIVIYL